MPFTFKQVFSNLYVVRDLSFYDGFNEFIIPQQIGYGNFSRVFKALKRIDGCTYAVKHSTRQLHLDTER